MKLMTVLGILTAAAGCVSQAHAASSAADPLRLAPWLSNQPLPPETRKLAAPTKTPPAISSSSSSSGGAAAAAPRSSSLLSGLRTSLRRRLQQLLHPNELSVGAALPTSASTTSWTTVALDPAAKGASIPADFLGISHEWTNVEELNHGGSYLQLLKDLSAYGSGSLVVRVGGGSTDMQRSLPPASTWGQLRQLHKATGFRYIFGLNFKDQNVSFAKAQMDAAQAALPRGAVLAYEVGNEPNYYETVGGMRGADFINCCLVNEWGRFGIALSCRNGSASCIEGRLAGPAWGHIHMAPATLDWFLRVNYRWVGLLTVHWYKATREAGNSLHSLLDEAPLKTEMGNLAQLVAVARKWGKPLRVAEMNTISNSGQRGLSNSLAAALWTLDTAFEAAAAGATGINLHWGDGASLYAALLRQSKGSSIVKPPYYAYLMFQMALGSGASFMGTAAFMATLGCRLKVWPLRDTATGAGRIVLLNKDAHTTAGLVLRFPASSGYGDGKLIRLVGARGLAEEWSVSLGNMTYKIGGKPFGVPAGEVVVQAPPYDSGGGGPDLSRYSQSYTVVMPPGSAALLILPRKAQR